MRMMRKTIWIVAAFAALAHGQQPFLTDDADTAPLRHFHVEILSEYDSLQRTSFPTIRQSTTRLQVTYGLLEKLEIGFDVTVAGYLQS